MSACRWLIWLIFVSLWFMKFQFKLKYRKYVRLWTQKWHQISWLHWLAVGGQCLWNYISTSAFDDVSYLISDVEAKFFCIKIYWTPAKMLLLADVDEYSFPNAGMAVMSIYEAMNCGLWRDFYITANCRARELWKLAPSCKQSHLLCLPDPRNLPGAALPSGFQSSPGALKSTE